MKKKCCVVIPIYKDMLNENEMKSFESCYRKLKEFHFTFIAPYNINDEYYKKKYRDIEIIKFSNWNRNSISDYNQLMLDIRFYRNFIEYKYIFVFQLDGMLLGTKSNLESFLCMDYDYIGAPWGEEGFSYCWFIIPGAGHLNFLRKIEHQVTCIVGNGGVSLRNTDKTIALLKEKAFYAKKWRKAEDIFFSYHGSKNKCGFVIAEKQVAQSFSLEMDMKEKIEGGLVPLAVHKWEKYFPELIHIAEKEKWL